MFNHPSDLRQSRRAKRFTLTPWSTLPFPSEMPQERRRRAGLKRSPTSPRYPPQSQDASDPEMADLGAGLSVESVPYGSVDTRSAHATDDPLDDWSRYGLDETDGDMEIPGQLALPGQIALSEQLFLPGQLSLPGQLTHPHQGPHVFGSHEQDANLLSPHNVQPSFSFDDFMNVDQLFPAGPAAAQGGFEFGDDFAIPNDLAGSQEFFGERTQQFFGERTQDEHGVEQPRSYRGSLEGFPDVPLYGLQVPHDQLGYLAPMNRTDGRIDSPQGHYDKFVGDDKTSFIEGHGNSRLDFAPGGGAASGYRQLLPKFPRHEPSESFLTPDLAKDERPKQKCRGKGKAPKVTKFGRQSVVDAEPTVGDEKSAPTPRQRKHIAVERVDKTPPVLKASGLHFSSIAEARQLTQGLKWGPREDETLPKTQQDRESIVLRLFAAIQDMSDVKDKVSGAMFRNRWLGTPTEEPLGEEEAAPREATGAFYDAWDKERICWEILHTAERIYRQGAAWVAILDPSKLAACEAARDLTFKERINTLERVCRQYKARVDKMLKGGVIEEYVLCPNTLITISRSNRGLNDTRMKDIVDARERDDRPSKKKAKTAKVAPTPTTASKGKGKRARDDSPDAPESLTGPPTKLSRMA